MQQLDKWYCLSLAERSNRCFYFSKMSKRVIDYAYKSYVLNEHSDLLIKQKRASLYEYALIQAYETGEIKYALRTHNKDYGSMSDLLDYCAVNGLKNELKECFKINHAEYERTKRLKNRVATMLLNGSCIFLTLTFTDATLKETTPQQRRVAVSRYLKQYNCMYVANIDFGKDKTKTMREHYHALINCDKVEFESWRRYGNINAERIRNRDIESDKTKLSKYIAKLSNHAIKETTKRSSLMYSR